MTVITCQLVANPHYISRSSSHNFSQVYIAVFCDIKSTSSLHRAARCFPLFPSLDRSEGVYSYWWRVVHSAAGHPGGSRRATPATPSFSAPWDINSMIGLEDIGGIQVDGSNGDATAQEETRPTYKVTGVSIAVSTGFLENQTYLSCSKMENEWKRLQICYSKYC